MPFFTPASCITCSASPARSRASSVEKVPPTIGATSRWALGKCGWRGCSRQVKSKAAQSVITALARNSREGCRRFARARSASKWRNVSILLDILDLDRLAGHSLRQGCGHESIEVAVERVTGRSRRDPGTQILHQLIRLQNVGTDLMAPPDVRLGGIGGIGLGLALLQLGLVEARLELLHCRCAVLVLRALVLAGDHDSGRNVRDPDCTIGGIDMLPAGAGRTVGVDPQFLFLDFDVNVVVDLGIDPDA